MAQIRTDDDADTSLLPAPDRAAQLGRGKIGSYRMEFADRWLSHGGGPDPLDYERPAGQSVASALLRFRAVNLVCVCRPGSSVRTYRVGSLSKVPGVAPIPRRPM